MSDAAATGEVNGAGRPQLMLVGGAWRPSAEAMEVRDPEDNSLVGFVSRATPEDAREAIARAVRYGTAAARLLPR